MKPLTALIAAAGLFMLAVAPAVADNLQPGEVHPDVRWFIHIDVEGLLETELGERMTQHLLADPDSAAGLQWISHFIGMDPLNGLHSVTLYGRSYDKQEAVSLIRGDYDGQRMLQLIQMNADYSSERHGLFTIHSWSDPDTGRLHYGAFYDDELIVFSDSQTALEEAIETLIDDRDPAGLAHEVMPGEPSKEITNAWLLIVAEEFPAEDDTQGLLHDVRRVMISIGEDEGEVRADLRLTCRSQEQSRRFRAMAEGLAALVQTFLAGPQGKELGDLGEEISVQGIGQEARMTVSMPAESVIRVLQSLETSGPAEDDDR